LPRAPTIDFSNVICASSAISGGAGKVREVISPRLFYGFTELYLKEFNPTRVNDGARGKLIYQIEHPPANLVAPRFRLAWPIGLVTAGTARLGFLMPGAFPNSIPLEELIVPTLAPNVQQLFRDRFDLGQPNALLNRMKAALNICAALQMLYSGGEYNVIDMKPNNILITPSGEVTLVDLDSIQILERGSVKFEGVDGTDRYKPPEGLGNRVYPSYKNIHWDEFSLAIILYQTMVGAPPHAASFGGAFSQCTDMSDKIRAGLFVFGRHESLIINRSPLHDTFKRLPDEVQQLFRRAFNLGHDNPAIRPSVVDWGGSIHRAVDLLESQSKVRSRASTPVNSTSFLGPAAIAAYASIRVYMMQRRRAILLTGVFVALLFAWISAQNPTAVYHQPQSGGSSTVGATQQPGSSTRSSPSPQQTAPQPSFSAPPPGYEWVDQSRALKRWVPGSAYGPRWPHMIASDEEGKWKAEPGYQLRDNNAVWVPGSAYGPRWPHMIASDEENKWKAEPGYQLRDNNAVWVPGLPYGYRWPHVVASDEEGSWEPEPGYQFRNNVDGEYDVMRIPAPSPGSGHSPSPPQSQPAPPSSPEPDRKSTSASGAGGGPPPNQPFPKSTNPSPQSVPDHPQGGTGGLY
jgi:hypothetical protein